MRANPIAVTSAAVILCIVEGLGFPFLWALAMCEVPVLESFREWTGSFENRTRCCPELRTGEE